MERPEDDKVNSSNDPQSECGASDDVYVVDKNKGLKVKRVPSRSNVGRMWYVTTYNTEGKAIGQHQAWEPGDAYQDDDV